MKRSIPTIITAAMALAVSAVNAKGDDKADADSNANKMVELKKELNRELSQNVVFPYQERQHDMHGAVVVTFVVDNEGKLEVLNMEGTSAHLADYVREKLQKVDLADNNSGIWPKTTVRFVFRKQS